MTIRDRSRITLPTLRHYRDALLRWWWGPVCYGYALERMARRREQLRRRWFLWRVRRKLGRRVRHEQRRQA